MKAIIFGAGGREHALAARLSAEGWGVTVAPGNAGLARRLACHPLALDQNHACVELARTLQVDLAVVGPEAPLIAGLADALRAEGIATFGPSAAAARIEGSKAFAKEVMTSCGVPTADYAAFTDAASARAFARARGGRVAVKADGIAGGKGVVVCADVGAAEAAIAAFLEQDSLGAAGRRVVIEERLEGPEVSLFALCHGEHATAFPLAHDYKRLREGDLGPNTGGMGAVAPSLRWGDVEGLLDLTLRPVLEELLRRGQAFSGLLFAGVMLTPAGPRVLEYNCRFGDPETQALLSTVDGELGEALLAVARGAPLKRPLRARAVAAVGVVVASAGYPEASRTGDVISGWEAAEARCAALYAAGVGERDGQLVTAGGRVATVVGVGANQAAARAQAFAAVDCLQFEGLQARRDVGLP